MSFVKLKEEHLIYHYKTYSKIRYKTEALSPRLSLSTLEGQSTVIDEKKVRINRVVQVKK